MMVAKSRYSLQRTMIIYFLLIGFASMLVGIEFWADFSGGTLKAEIWHHLDQYERHQINRDQVLAPIDRLRSKAILMVAIIMVVMLIVLTMFIKNITEPLQHMIQLSRKISAGDLSQTVRVDANNELADLGHVINEMASNLQEIILLSQQICANGRVYVDSALGQLDRGDLVGPTADQLRKAIGTLGDELSTMGEMIAYFSFYSFDQKHDAG
jgi:nitrogen fixation/metabolism regulation signal transduction histidine kinase